MGIRMQRMVRAAGVAAALAVACCPASVMAGKPAPSGFRRADVAYAIREVGPCYGSNTDGREAQRIYERLPSLRPALFMGEGFRTPCIYAIPGTTHLFVVVADGKDERGINGLRMSVLREHADALTLIFATRAWTEGYTYDVAFVATGGRLLLVAEPQYEYSLGLEFYEIVGATTVEALGRIPAYREPEESSLLPKLLAGYHSGWEIAFCERIVLDIGKEQYTTMKPKHRGHAIVFRQPTTADTPSFRVADRAVRGICRP